LITGKYNSYINRDSGSDPSKQVYFKFFDGTEGHINYRESWIVPCQHQDELWKLKERKDIILEFESDDEEVLPMNLLIIFFQGIFCSFS
jgi:hypothetical protein